jgi:hypothetical protein
MMLGSAFLPALAITAIVFLLREWQRCARMVLASAFGFRKKGARIFRWSTACAVYWIHGGAQNIPL